jgi:hypothetical protein
MLVKQPFCRGIQAGYLGAQVLGDRQRPCGAVTPHVFQGFFAGPQLLGERRPVVRGIAIHRQQPDAAHPIVAANSLHGCRSGHSAADDGVAIRDHMKTLFLLACFFCSFGSFCLHTKSRGHVTDPHHDGGRLAGNPATQAPGTAAALMVTGIRSVDIRRRLICSSIASYYDVSSGR